MWSGIGTDALSLRYFQNVTPRGVERRSLSRRALQSAVVLLTLTVLVASCSRGCVDINTASARQLERIVHVGPVRAQSIIDLRPFSSVAGIQRVSGIGPARIRDIHNQGLACVE